MMNFSNNVFGPQPPRFLPIKPPKRKVFISFHHANDQQAYNILKRLFSDKYEVFEDHSLNNQLINSQIAENIDRAIRERFIKGSSITIVLCGEETHKRKYVDWEINSTLLHEHALLGIVLPTATKNVQNQHIVPDRLAVNANSGYAHWELWDNCAGSADNINMAIEVALLNSKNKKLLDNSLPKMHRNL
ncbi:MAG: TIR domain-containing protein [Patescibacteria group bacterium]